MEYIEAPEEYHGDLPTVFLAGGIGNCSDWQAKVVANLADCEVALLNPRRKQFRTPWNYADSQEQILWEYQALRVAKLVLFWFDGGESVQPIALFELGTYAARPLRPIVVGRDPGYLRRDDIDIQMGLYRPGQEILDSLDEVCDTVRAWVV